MDSSFYNMGQDADEATKQSYIQQQLQMLGIGQPATPQLQPTPGLRVGPLRLSGSGLDSAALSVLQNMQGAPRPQGFGANFAAGLAQGLAGGRVRQAQSRAAYNEAQVKGAADQNKVRATEAGKALADYRHSQTQMFRDQQREKAAANKPAAAGREMFTLPDGSQIPMTAALATGLAKKAGVIDATVKPVTPKIDEATMARLKRVAAGIKTGALSPDLETYGRDTNIKVALADELLKIGVVPKELSNQYLAEKTFLRSANGTVAMRLGRNVVNARNGIPLSQKYVDEAEQNIADRSDVKEINAAVMGAAMRGAYGPVAAKSASRLRTQLRGLSLELANIYQGGTAPTDNTVKKLMDVLDSNWNKDDLTAALEVAQLDLGIRVQAMKEIGPIGLSGGKPTNIPESVDSTAAKKAAGKTGASKWGSH